MYTLFLCNINHGYAGQGLEAEIDYHLSRLKFTEIVMGKHLISSEESTGQIQQVNQGCMWGMFHIFDYHRWGVKRVFHCKKKRHARCKQFHIYHTMFLLLFYHLIFCYFLFIQ